MSVNNTRKRGIEYEIMHWECKLTQQGHSDMEDMEMDASIAAYLPAGTGLPLKVLDVGCGPTFTIGGMHKGEKLELVGIDPLNDEYGKLLHRLKIRRSHRMVTGTGEELLTHFDKNSFDLVFSKNALDHAQDPYKAIQSMVEVCKEECCVVFTVFKNEALNANYVGFHQWNFSEVENTLLFWNPLKAHVLDECVQGAPYSLIAEKHALSKRKYPIKLTCVIHKPTGNLDKWVDVGNGLFINYNGRYQYISLTRTDAFSMDERFFIHVIRQGKIAENISFHWDLRQKFKSFVLKGICAEALVIGQYAVGKDGNKKKTSRFWEKEFQLTEQKIRKA